jgi:CspA family cold shock protein
MDRGFGFIKCDDEGSLFFHFSNVVDKLGPSLREGDKVEFDEVEGDRGPNAINVQKV